MRRRYTNRLLISMRVTPSVVEDRERKPVAELEDGAGRFRTGVLGHERSASTGIAGALLSPFDLRSRREMPEGQVPSMSPGGRDEPTG